MLNLKKKKNYRYQYSYDKIAYCNLSYVRNSFFPVNGKPFVFLRNCPVTRFLKCDLVLHLINNSCLVLFCPCHGWSCSLSFRFMICCDICLDWFHGKCVGITKSKGKVCQKYRYQYMYYCALLIMCLFFAKRACSQRDAATTRT